MIQRHQWEEPSMKSKYKTSTYHKDYSSGGSNIDLNLITCEDKIVIMSKLQTYELHWYHTYLLHPGIDKTEGMIFQNVYLPKIINSIRREVTNGYN